MCDDRELDEMEDNFHRVCDELETLRDQWQELDIKVNNQAVEMAHQAEVVKTCLNHIDRLEQSNAELLAALEACLNCVDMNLDELDPSTIEAIEQAERAIAKAKGE